MKIEKFYLANALCLKKEVLEQAQEELKNMTPEQLAEERRFQDEQFAMIREKIADREAHDFDVLDKSKEAIFKLQSECALKVAKELELDVIIDTRGTKGTIQLFSDILLLQVPVRSWIYKTFLGLISHADSLWFEVVKRYDENVMRFCLFYDLSED